MSFTWIIILSITYLSLIFGAAYVSERSTWLRNRFLNTSLVYALSLGVYCTAWTFYGSVGRAALSGIGFLGVYLGPTLIAPLWLFFLKKIIRISQHLRITSIADFISSRYGKNTTLGVMVSILSLFIVVPYISIQLKALEFSFDLLHYGLDREVLSRPFYQDPAMIFVLIFAGFAIFFGTRKLDPSEKHPGVVSVLALESLIKLLCFLIGALLIVYGMFDGVQDVFSQASTRLDLPSLTILSDEGLDYHSWFWIMLLSALAFVLLPRQFHIAVVENNSARHLKKATWLLPLYLLLMSIGVLPVAYAGQLLLGSQVEADTFLLSLPISQGNIVVASIVYIGGLAAISGMIMISMISLSIMISNNIFLPILLRIRKQYQYFLDDLNTRLLQLRRVIIVLVMLLSYAFFKSFSINYSIVSVGLMSFAGIAQLAPLVFFGIYWKSVSAKGAIAGLAAGVIVWAYTLPMANAAELGILSRSIIEIGPWGISALKPTALFGLDGMSAISHGAFWSLTINILTIVVVSLYTERTPLEITQSDIFLNPEKYYKSSTPANMVIVREAVFSELKSTLTAILGQSKVDHLLDAYYKKNKITTPPKIADSQLITYIENHLSGSIGTASANIVLNNLVEEKPVNSEELIQLLDQTYQVYQYSQALEKKSNQLVTTTNELKAANQQLQELDLMKNEFISNVTHELRTPITSIRSLADIMLKYEVSEDEKQKFLNIINEEAKRVSQLINQVLDLRKAEFKPEIDSTSILLHPLITSVVTSLSELAGANSITVTGDPKLSIVQDQEKLKQIIVNLIANAIKFTAPSNRAITVDYIKIDKNVNIHIIDNGVGINAHDCSKIFDRFYQVNSGTTTKSKGSGLGLSISRNLARLMGGDLLVKSEVGMGSTFTLILPVDSRTE